MPGDDHLAPDGRVMEVLSEHLCQGWLEGYLLTGRHGLFTCYEAFIHIVDSMFNQHAKWLKVTRGIPWRRPIASLNYLLTSHVWRQDHNGFSHQDPGFIDHVVNKKAEIVRVYLPPDANCLLSVADHCLRSRDYVNVIVAGKQPAPRSTSTMDEAIAHCTRGIGIWEWAGSDEAGEPDVVLGLRRRRADARDARRRGAAARAPARPAGARRQRRRPDAPAARDRAPARPVRRASSTRCSPTDKPVIFAYHGYPWLIHRLTYRRTNHRNLHVRGYKEEGTTTTPFDMVMLNDMDRFHLVMDVIDRVPGLGARAAHAAPARWSTSGCATARVHARGRRGHARRARLGAGRAGAAARAGARRQRRVEQPEAAAARRGDDAAGARPTCPHHGPTVDDDGARRAAIAGVGDVDAVGHRIVHGGERFRDAVRIDDARACGELQALTDLAPLHQPKSLAALDAVRRALPDVPAVACFDTAFHATLPAAAATYALPAAWRERWRLRRYGFHGLSHAYASRRAAELLGAAAASRVVTCHLGAGRVARRGPRRPLGRHDDGLHAARGPGHGDALGQRRPRARCCGSCERGLIGVAEMADGARARAPACWRSPGTADMREVARRATTATTRAARARRLPPPAARRRSRRWPPRSAGSTRSCSPAASASTRRAVRAARRRRPGLPRRRDRRGRATTAAERRRRRQRAGRGRAHARRPRARGPRDRRGRSAPCSAPARAAGRRGCAQQRR